MRIGIDVDDVLVDFVNPFLKWVNKEYVLGEIDKAENRIIKLRNWLELYSAGHNPKLDSDLID